MINSLPSCSICLQDLYGQGHVIGHGPNNLHPIHRNCMISFYESSGRNDLRCPECRKEFEVTALFPHLKSEEIRIKVIFVNMIAAISTTAAMYGSLNLIVQTMGAVFIKFQELALVFTSEYLIKGDLFKLTISMVVIAPCQLGILFLTGGFCFYSLALCSRLADRVGLCFRDYKKRIVHIGVIGGCVSSLACVVLSAGNFFNPAIPLIASGAISGYLAFKNHS